MTSPVDTDACDRCGSQRLDLRNVPALRRLGRWLTHGRPVPDLGVRCRQCGHAWMRRSGSTGMLVAYGSRSVWRLPLRLVRVLTGIRTWQPNPALYLGAAAVGTAVGILVDAFTAVPWWVGTVTGPATVFALSVVRAVRSPFRQHPLRVELLRVLAPDRYADRIQQEEERWLRETDLPLLGLDGHEDWFRFVSGIGRSGNAVTGVELAHHPDLDDQTTQVRVETRRGRLEHIDSPGDENRATIRAREDRANRGALVRWLAGTVAGRAEGPPSSDPARRKAWHDRIVKLERDLASRQWAQHPIPIADSEQPFDVLARADCWVATARRDGWHVNLRACGYDPHDVRLTRVDDLQPYLEGRHRLRDRHRPDRP